MAHEWPSQGATYGIEISNDDLEDEPRPAPAPIKYRAELEAGTLIDVDLLVEPPTELASPTTAIEVHSIELATRFTPQTPPREFLILTTARGGEPFSRARPLQFVEGRLPWMPFEDE